MKILREHIIDKLQESRATQISKVTEPIKNNAENGGKIWVAKRKLKKKEQNPHQILTSQGQKLENKDKIFKEYAKYYKALLKIRLAENMEEEKIEQTVDKKFQEIIAGGKSDRGIIITTEKKIGNQGNQKRKKAGDKNNWKAEWIKEGGKEMVECLATLFSRVEGENTIPIQ